MNEEITPEAREVFKRFNLPVYRPGDRLVHCITRTVAEVTKPGIRWTILSSFWTYSYPMKRANGKSTEEFQELVRLATLEEEIAFENTLAKQYTHWGYST